MNIDLTQEIKTIDGVTIPLNGRETDRPTVLSDILTKAMLETPQAEAASMPGEKKMQRYRLAQKCYGVPSVDLEVEELAVLKEYVGKLFPALVVGQVWQMLEGK